MEPFAALLPADLEPHLVLELSDEPVRSSHVGTAYPDAEVIRLLDRAALGRQPDSLEAGLEQLPSSIDLVLDHANGDAAVTLAIFEALFSRLTPGAAYIVDGPLPATVVLQLMFGSVVSPDLIDTVATSGRSTIVRRGPREAFADRLSLGDLSSDPFGIIA